MVVATPQSVEEFSQEWVSPHMMEYWGTMKGKDTEKIQIVSVKAEKNSLQGILSQTFIVDVVYKDDNPILDEFDDSPPEDEDGNRTKSIFVKVPLKANNEMESLMYRAVNMREKIMLTQVLPKLQTFLDEKCEGFFRLPMPEVLHVSYDPDQGDDSNVFIMENLTADSYLNYDGETCLDSDHMNSVLETLGQLHGTGLAYKKLVGNCQKDLLKTEFPGLEEQIQVKDLLDTPEKRSNLRKYYRAYLHYLEEAEPKVSNHTGYMKNMYKHILTVIDTLEGCGYDKLLTFCHGDAKPNNFLFRNIEIDIEELECEGIQSILIDWQGGFLGCAANDLMWALFPFLEKHAKDKTLFKKAVEYYHDQLKNVLESFNCTMEDLDLPEDLPGFGRLLQRSLVLEFLVVTVIKPIVSLKNPEALLRWHKETIRNRNRRFKKSVEKPDPEDVFPSARFSGFCHLYFRIATAMEAFQEMGRIYFDIMRDSMFEGDGNQKVDTYDSDTDEPDPDIFYRIINYPMPDLKKVEKKTWMKIGAASTALLVTGVGVAFGAAYDWGQ